MGTDMMASVMGTDMMASVMGTAMMAASSPLQQSPTCSFACALSSMHLSQTQNAFKPNTKRI